MIKLTKERTFRSLTWVCFLIWGIRRVPCFQFLFFFIIIPLLLCWFLPFFNKIYISIQYTKSTWNAYICNNNITNFKIVPTETKMKEKKTTTNIKTLRNIVMLSFSHIHAESGFFFLSSVIYTYILCKCNTHQFDLHRMFVKCLSARCIFWLSFDGRRLTAPS